MRPLRVPALFTALCGLRPKFRGREVLVICRLPFLAAAGGWNRVLAREKKRRFRSRTARKRGVLGAQPRANSCTQMLILVTADVPRGSMSYFPYG